MLRTNQIVETFWNSFELTKEQSTDINLNISYHQYIVSSCPLYINIFHSQNSKTVQRQYFYSWTAIQFTFMLISCYAYMLMTKNMLNMLLLSSSLKKNNKFTQYSFIRWNTLSFFCFVFTSGTHFFCVWWMVGRASWRGLLSFQFWVLCPTNKDCQYLKWLLPVRIPWRQLCFSNYLIKHNSVYVESSFLDNFKACRYETSV